MKKRIVALMLAVVMLFGEASPIFAETMPTEQKTAEVIETEIAAEPENMKDVSSLPTAHEEAGLTKEEYDAAVELHGSAKIFGRELSVLRREGVEYGFAEEKIAELKQLICAGYSYHQAVTALAAGQDLGLSVEYLCEKKIEELTEEEEPEINAVTYSADDVDYTDLAIKLGLPESVVMENIGSDDEMAENAINEVQQDMEEMFPPAYEVENAADEDGIAEPYAVSKGTAYRPELAIPDPYDYKNYGNLDINLSSGSYIYTETDLSIPGINGLDFKFNRIFDSAFAYNATPYIDITTNSTYLRAYTIRVTIAGGTIVDTGEYITNLSRYKVVDSDMQAVISSDGTRFRTQDYKKAITRYRELQAMTYETTYAVVTPSGERVGMCFDPVVETTGNYGYAYENMTEPYNYLINENGLGQGWRLGFSAIEHYLTDDLEESQTRLILSDGKVYNLEYGSKNVTGLNDLTFNWNEKSYPGASYSLKYADGKTEYFDRNGRNVAIVDRFGNAITLNYTLNGSRVTAINITDTVGNNIVYQEAEVENPDNNGAGCIDDVDVYYTKKHTLSLNGDIVCSYYAYEFEKEGITLMQGVENAEHEWIFYYDVCPKQKFSCITTAASSIDGYIYYAHHNGIKYPSKFAIEFAGRGSKKAKDIFAYCGYIEKRVVQRVNYEDYLNEQRGETTDFVIGDSTGYYIPPSEDTYYISSETRVHALKIPNKTGLNIMDSRRVEYKFNYEHELVSKTTYLYEPRQDDTFVDWPDEIGKFSETTYSYTTKHLPSQVTTRLFEPGNTKSYMSQVYKYTYDAKGNVLTETQPNGLVTEYKYDSIYNILTSTKSTADDIIITKQNTLTADKKSIAESQVLENGQTVSRESFLYDTQGRVTRYRDYLSEDDYADLYYFYNGGAQAVEECSAHVKDADGNLIQSNGTGNASGIADFAYKTEAEYNTLGLPVKTVDENGNATLYEYDNIGRLTKKTNPDGTTEIYVYAPAKGTIIYTNAEDSNVKYQYDGFGRLVEIYDMTGQKAIVNYRYDNMNRLVLETVHSKDDTQDISTYYYYDNADRLIEKGIRAADGTDIPTEKYTYRADLGKTVKTIMGSGNAPTRTEVVYTDKMGNVISSGAVLNGEEITDTFKYDKLNRQTEYLSAYSKSLNQSFTEKYTYDAMGNRLTITDAFDTESNEYDYNGNLLKTTHSDGSKTENTYDSLGRLLAQKAYMTADTAVWNKYYYDGAGNLLRALTSKGTASANGTPASFDETSYVYDNMNRAISSYVDMGGGQSIVTAVEYDDMGRTKKTTAGRLQTGDLLDGPLSVTNYAYDIYGHLVSETDPLGVAEAYDYDINGNPLSYTDRNGVESHYSYDSYGNLSQVTTGTGSDAITTNYNYAVNGSLLDVSQGDGTIAYTYDALGRLVDEQNGQYNKHYEYNRGNLRTKMTLSSPDGELFSYNRTYDVGGRLTGVSGGGASASYTYDNVGRPLTSSADNGVENSLQYDLSGHVTQAGNSLNGSAFQTRNYTYDMSGRQSSFESNTGRQTSYAYDGAGRLTNENSTADSRAYGYDSRSNRVTLEKGQEQLGYTYNLADGLVSEGNIEYTYDSNGDMTSKSGGADGSVSYTYDLQDRQTKVVKNGMTADYTYYPDGMRKSKTVNGEETIYIWDGSRLLAEVTGSGTTYYLWGLRLVAGIKGNDIEYYHHDGHGNVTAVTDENGAVLKSYEYDAFGVELNEDASDGNPFRYCGAYYDKETGLYYLINRYYDPTLGRFTQKDPAKDGSNWYIYCYNDPINLLDALGLKPTAEAAAAMAAHIYEASMDMAENKKVVAGWQLIDIKYGDSSMKMGIYIPKGDDISNPSEYVLAFKGSTLKADKETVDIWVNNLLAMQGPYSRDVRDSMLLSAGFCYGHKGYEITMVGHSKGGGQAIAAAKFNNTNAITFNAANYDFEKYNLTASPDDADKIQNYYIEGEILSWLTGYAKYGNTNILSAPNRSKGGAFTFKEMVANHEINNFLPAFLLAGGNS